MWTHTIAPLIMILAIFALMLAVPVCLGVLLRLLIRNTQPSLVTWFGAALGLAAQHGPAHQSTIMRSMPAVLPFADDSLLATLSLRALDLLIPLALWFVFVKLGVKLVDRQAKQQSRRLWLVLNPVIAVTAYVCLMFGLMSLYLSTGSQAKFATPFAVLYRFILWELLYILCATFAITMLYVNQIKRKPPNQQVDSYC